MQKINILDVLSSLQGTMFMGIDFETTATLTGGKSNPFQGRVTKRVTNASVMAFANKYVNGYEAMVKRRLKDEGKDADNFVLGPRAWGTRVDGLPLVTHNDSVYLDVIFSHSGDTEYLVDGVVTDPATITGLKASEVSGEQGGLDNKVVIRTINLENVRTIRANKQTFSGEFFYDQNQQPNVVATPVVRLSDQVLSLLNGTTSTIQPGSDLTHDEIFKLIEVNNQLRGLIDNWLNQALSGKTV